MVIDGNTRAGDDERYMLEAVKEAARAAEEGEVPVGAVIVKDGQIIARAHNRIEASRRSSAHAEMLALEAAEEKLGAKWLTGATMYVTLEPCSMCAGAMVLARIARLVIGTDDPKTGACGSLYNIASDERLNHSIEITRGVLAEECSALLKEFFRSRR
ncbi:MAG: tRNA adenosine(34) deaminase TadA [Mogibacterium sp.]|nr:tRNA adenosine(34) deaminase TadA [Mogibacterium sp.]